MTDKVYDADRGRALLLTFVLGVCISLLGSGLSCGDDSYIYMNYARSVFENHAYAYNGTPSTGVTSLAWLLLAGSFAEASQRARAMVIATEGVPATVALSEASAFGYYPGLPIADTEGLVSRHALQFYRETGLKPAASRANFDRWRLYEVANR